MNHYRRHFFYLRRLLFKKYVGYRFSGILFSVQYHFTHEIFDTFYDANFYIERKKVDFVNLVDLIFPTGKILAKY